MAILTVEAKHVVNQSPRWKAVCKYFDRMEEISSDGDVIKFRVHKEGTPLFHFKTNNQVLVYTFADGLMLAGHRKLFEHLDRQGKQIKKNRNDQNR